MTTPNPLIAAYLRDRLTWNWDPEVDGEDGPEARWLWYLSAGEHDIPHTETQLAEAQEFIKEQVPLGRPGWMKVTYSDTHVHEFPYTTRGMAHAIMGMYAEPPTILKYELAGRDY